MPRWGVVDGEISHLHDEMMEQETAGPGLESFENLDILGYIIYFIYKFKFLIKNLKKNLIWGLLLVALTRYTRDESFTIARPRSVQVFNTDDDISYCCPLPDFPSSLYD